MKRAAIFVLLVACKHASDNKVKDTSNETIDRNSPVTCEVGEYVPLSIVTDPSTPNGTPLIWEAGDGFTAVNSSTRSTARIDVCYDEATDRVDLKRVIISPVGPPSAWDEVHTSGFGEIKGLKEALFSDTNGLLIGQTATFLQEIRGVNIQGKDYVALSTFNTVFVPGKPEQYSRRSRSS
ncbi:MAG: hypothetical protein AB7T49_11125 [Oligoflexales bacterium]